MNRLLMILLFLALGGPAQAKEAARNDAAESGVCDAHAVCVFIPVFDGPGELGRNTATVLNLQIWQTLRKVAGRRGAGVIIWGEKPLNEPTHRAAQQAAKDCPVSADRGHGCDMVFWGKAYAVGDEAVVLSYLTLADDNRDAISWRVWIKGKEVVAERPTHLYSFQPFVLSKAMVQQYRRPDALILTGDDGKKYPIGQQFKALEQSTPSRARVQIDTETGPVRGTIRLPNLTDRSVAVDFTAAIVRALRQDWNGTEDLMDRVIDRQGIPVRLRSDALWYRAMSRSEEKKQVNDDLNTRDLPLTSRLLATRVMGSLADYQNAKDDSLEKTRDAINRYCKHLGNREDVISVTGASDLLNLDFQNFQDCKF